MELPRGTNYSLAGITQGRDYPVAEISLGEELSYGRKYPGSEVSKGVNFQKGGFVHREVIARERIFQQWHCLSCALKGKQFV